MEEQQESWILDYRYIFREEIFITFWLLKKFYQPNKTVGEGNCKQKTFSITRKKSKSTFSFVLHYSQPEAEDLYELIAERHLSKSFIFSWKSKNKNRKRLKKM